MVPVDSHIILDIGPGLLSWLTAFLVAAPGFAAAYYAFRANQAIKVHDANLVARVPLLGPQGDTVATVQPPPTKVG